jgi:hypothetical protein
MPNDKNPITVLGLGAAYIRLLQQLPPDRRKASLTLLRKYHNSVLHSDVTGKSSELLASINGALDELLKPGRFDSECQGFLAAPAAVQDEQWKRQALQYRQQLDNVASEVHKRDDTIKSLENKIAAWELKVQIDRLAIDTTETDKLKRELSGLKKQLAETRINLTTAYLKLTNGHVLGYLAVKDAEELGIKVPCAIPLHYPAFSRVMVKMQRKKIDGYLVAMEGDTLHICSPL